MRVIQHPQRHRQPAQTLAHQSTIRVGKLAKKLASIASNSQAKQEGLCQRVLCPHSHTSAGTKKAEPPGSREVYELYGDASGEETGCHSL